MFLVLRFTSVAFSISFCTRRLPSDWVEPNVVIVIQHGHLRVSSFLRSPLSATSAALLPFQAVGIGRVLQLMVNLQALATCLRKLVCGVRLVSFALLLIGNLLRDFVPSSVSNDIAHTSLNCPYFGT